MTDTPDPMRCAYEGCRGWAEVRPSSDPTIGLCLTHAIKAANEEADRAGGTP